jgi:acyl-CoA hydrolase
MQTTTFKLVMPEHLNHYGFLFGGNLLKWVDEVAWMAVSRDFPACQFLTVAMDQVEFRKRSGNGDILRFEADQVQRGHTSVQYRVTVFRRPLDRADEELMFSTTVTQVRVDENGNKQNLP